MPRELLDMESVCVWLVDVVPNIEEAHQGEVAFWPKAPPSRGETYLESFISFLRARLERADHRALDPAFALLEVMAASGDAEAKAVLRSELLPALIAAPHGNHALLQELMGPRTQREWDLLLTHAGDRLGHMIGLLSPAGRQAAEYLIERNLAAVTKGVVDLDIKEPVCALCLLPTHDGDLLDEGVEGGFSLGTVCIQTPAKRDQAVKEDPADWLVNAWLADRFAYDYEPLPNIRDDPFRAAERTLEAALGDQEMPFPDDGSHRDRYRWELWPVGWLYNQVCVRLYEQPPPDLQTTDDFVVLHQDPDFEPNPVDLLPDLAPSHIVDLLRARGYYRSWSEILPEGEEV